MAEPSGACDNCERKIGRLEQQYQWQGHTVCFDCHERLVRGAAKQTGTAPGEPAAAPQETEAESVRWRGSPAVVRYLPLYALLALLGLGAAVGACFLHWAFVLALPVLIVILLIEEVERRSVRYTITTRRVIGERGIIAKDHHEVRLGIIQEVTCHQTIAGRVFGYGTVGIDTAASGEAEIVMAGIPEPRGVVRLLGSLRG
jgi:membrane protein YdbS with pleckstrin-like domain